MELMQNPSKFNVQDILKLGRFSCSCGKCHATEIKEILIEHEVLLKIPDLIRKYNGTRAFLVSDMNTNKAVGEKVCSIMKANNLPYSYFIFPQEHLEPDESSLGRVSMQYDPNCDFIVGIGSGTINDIGKVLARNAGRPYMIVATAPSMDGYASSTSSMVLNKVKVSVDSTCPTIILADPVFLSKAPERLLQAGMGDMLSKYISICEWRISHIVTGEYFCENIAAMVRSSLEKCIAVENLAARNPDDIIPVMEGLILSGMAMGFAGLSRPASGMEHYFSHLWDMRALEFQTPSDLHGIQCGVATLISLRVYEFLRDVIPDRHKAMAYVKNFSLDAWNRSLIAFLGEGAEPLIQLEAKEGKYNLEAHGKRLELILSRWDEILNIISEELPQAQQVEQILLELGAPTTSEELGHSKAEVRDTLSATKDIRNKYIGSCMLWDLGLLDEVRGII